jgi:hypothetical protein
MPDITMCKNKDCVRHEWCYRFVATPSLLQSFFTEDVRELDGSCTYYWEVRSDKTR